MGAYSKWKRILLIILGVLLLGLMAISAGGRTNISWLESVIGNLVTPVQSVTQHINEGIVSRISPIFEVWDTLEENAKLKKENVDLRSQIITLSLREKEVKELQNLEGALNYVRSKQISTFVSADVVGKNPGNWYNTFTVNVGKKNGVTKNSTVINGDGLVGTIYEVGDNWSKVVTIIDNKCSVSFETVNPTQSYEGFITGSINSTIKGQLFDPLASITSGQTVITSGLGVHPKGIGIGRIKEVVKNKDDLLLTVIVEPLVNFRKIDKVLIIPNTSLNFD